jgi:hypothetical protein
VITDPVWIKRIDELPTPAKDREFITYAIRGGTGVASNGFICLNDGTDTYDWFPWTSSADSRVYDERDFPGATSNARVVAAIAAASAAGGGKVLMSRAAYDFTGMLASINVPENVHIEGNGGLVTTPAGVAFPVFDIDGMDNARISNLRLFKTPGTSNPSGGYGIRVRGACDRPTIEHVIAYGYRTGIHINGSVGTVPGVITNLTLRDSKGINSPTNYGIDLRDIDGGVVDNCVGMWNWLDGMKFTAKVFNVLVLGGLYNENGQVRIATGSGTGDGIDAFAGADTCSFLGVTLDYNNGNGLVIKTDTLTRDAPATYGYVRGAQVIGCRARHNTPGSGMRFYRWPAGDLTIPMAAWATFSGNYTEGNAEYGYYFGALGIVSSGDIARRNGRDGFYVPGDGLHVKIRDPLCIANGQVAANTYDGIAIFGKHVTVSGGTILGVDADAIYQESDLAALTEYHRRNIFIDVSAEHIQIEVDDEDYNASSQGIRTNMTSGICIIHQRGAGTPVAIGVYGGLGSTHLDTSTGILWRKTSGAPNAPTTGWQETAVV